MQIAKYFASLGFDVDTKGLKKVDKALDTLEKKLKGFSGFGNLSFGIGNFTVDQRKLERTLGNALDMASNRVVFDINKFVVNQAALNQTVGLAMTRAGMAHPLRVTPQPSVVPRVVPRVVAPTPRTPRTTTTAAVGGGMIGRGLSSLYAPALALGLGGYGLSALNKRNQEVVAAQLQTQAVIMGNGGTAQQGEQSFDWLRKQANRVGFNYLDAAGDFNVLTSNLLGSGGTVAQSQNIFKGFAEYGRVNKLSPARQKLVFNALSQIAGKDKLQAEELTKQLGNSLPGAKDIFAQAYQQQLRETGKGKGDLTGSAAIIALEAAMKKGQVRGNILNYAANIASERSQPGLVKASQASQAEQARYQNTVNDMAIVASNSGVEEGFARIFRTLNAGLSESGDLIKVLAEGFNDATKWADDLLLFPQSFIRALEGKDSLVADWLGVGKTSQLVKDWQDIKTLWEQMSALNPTNLFGEFLPTLQATTKELAAILNAIGEFQRWKSGNLPTTETNNSSTEEATLFGWKYPSPAAVVGDVINNTGVNLNRARNRGRALYEDGPSASYDDAADYDSLQADMAKAAAEDKAMGIVNNNANQIDIVVNVDGSTLAGMNADQQAQAIGEAVANMFVQSFDQVNVQFPVKQ